MAKLLSEKTKSNTSINEASKIALALGIKKRS